MRLLSAIRTESALRRSVAASILCMASVAIDGGCSSPTAPAGPLFFGRVTESRPTDTTPVAGARLELQNGPSAGRTAIASTDGSFLLEQITGVFDVAVRAAGYDDALVHVDASAGDVHQDILLMPKLQTVTETIGSFSGPRRPPTTFFRNVHHDGSIVVSNLYFYFLDLYSPSFLGPQGPATRTVEIWAGDRFVAASSINEQQYYFVDLKARVSGGARYEIRLIGGEWSAVTIESPN
jgi:hypothetical protein